MAEIGGSFSFFVWYFFLPFAAEFLALEAVPDGPGVLTRSLSFLSLLFFFAPSSDSARPPPVPAPCSMG